MRFESTKNLHKKWGHSQSFCRSYLFSFLLNSKEYERDMRTYSYAD